MARYLLLFAILLFLMVSDVVAQRTGRGGGGTRRRPPAAPAGDPAAPPTLEQTLREGDVPDFQGLSDLKPLEFLPFSENPGAGPVVPSNVVRYLGQFMDKYDKNGDGVLQYEEWKSLPGAPQAMDLDGDQIITLDELILHTVRYAKGRSIHHPVPSAHPYSPQVAAAPAQFFHPLSAPLKSIEPPKTETDTPKEADVTASQLDETAKNGETEAVPGGETVAATEGTEGTEDETETVPQEDEDVTFEVVLGVSGKKQVKKYYRPLSELKGVPAWFIARDKNGDGQLSMLEFAPNLSSAALALFAKLDKNQDGFITPEEILAWKAESQP